jgi:7,8-dihydro-6-hydroxymethylpterin-pyrophosphokinase
VIDESDLTVPDPELRTRPYVAVPLLELAPDLVLPNTRERLATLAAAHDRGGLTPEPSVTDELRVRLNL